MGRLETNRRSKISLDCSFKSRLCQQKICQYCSLLDFYVLGVYVGWTTSPGMTSSCRGATGTFSWSWTELTLPGNVQVTVQYCIPVHTDSHRSRGAGPHCRWFREPYLRNSLLLTTHLTQDIIKFSYLNVTKILSKAFFCIPVSSTLGSKHYANWVSSTLG